MLQSWTRCLAAALAGMSVVTVAVAAEMDWLSLCGKCLSPGITSKSGIGTANALAEGRITRREAEGWCANWSPGENIEACVRRELPPDIAKRTYRARADCTQGRITAIDGNTYTLAGKWTSDVGRGRTKWRDASGKIVGQDNASNGLAISQQWEVLCPATAQAAATSRAATPSPKPASAALASRFAVGEIVEAKYGRDWVRGRVSAVRQVSGQRGVEIAYDVQLDNGKRGVLPERMVRKVPGN